MSAQKGDKSVSNWEAPKAMSSKISQNTPAVQSNGAEFLSQIGQNFSAAMDNMMNNAEVLVLNFNHPANQYAQFATPAGPMGSWNPQSAAPK